MITKEEIESIVERPSEGLSWEIKNWIDPLSPQGVQKIVIACFALRNRNGGFLLIGFDDKTLLPNVATAPQDVEAKFHVDIIQGIISKYASQPFEVSVGFGYRDGFLFPVVKVEEGVRAPVAVKSALPHPSGGTLLQEGDVYFRTLRSNGTPSSARALWRDWPDIVDICFENREADIGRFLRRHLGPDSALRFVEMTSATKSSLQQKLVQLLEEGEQSFQVELDRRVKSNALTTTQRDKILRGRWSVGLVIDPPNENAVASQTFLNVIANSNPRYTGWPIWLDSRGFTDRSAAPLPVNGVWQAFIASMNGGFSDHFDFWRIDPKGSFFLLRTLQDDLTDKTKPFQELEAVLVIIRTAEAIAVGLAFAKAAGWNDDATLGFSFKWSHLNGRELSTWANPMVGMIMGRKAHDDSVTTFVEVSAATAPSAIAPYVYEAIKPLFLAFDGFEIPFSSVEQWVQRLIERRL